MQSYATYRKHFVRADAVQAVVVTSALAGANLLFLANDRALFGDDAPFPALAAVRIGMFLATLVTDRILLRTASWQTHDRTIVAWCTLFAAMFAYSSWTRPPDYIGYGAPSAAIVIGTYAMLTGPMLPRAIAAAAISVFTFAFAFRSPRPVLGFNAVLFTHVAAHALGLFVGSRISNLRRTSFRAHQALAVKAAQLEEEKLRAEALARAKSDFLASMSHELRTPMNAVIGMTELLATAPLPDEQKGQVAAVHDSARGLLVVLNDILDMAKVDAGRLAVNRAPFDLRALVRSIHQLFQPSAHGLAFDLVLADDVAVGMDGDAARIRQVLSNLVANAIKFTKSGWVRLEVTRDSERVAFAVADSGPGISAELRPRLFSPFEQGAGAVGTGLGLAISKRLAEAMDGTLGLADSEVGARFVLRLPAREVPLPARAATQNISPRVALRVLVADDNETNRRVARAMFAHLGHSVDVVDSGEGALAAIANGRFDLACLDLRMPGMGGLATATALRAKHPALRVIALTASTFAEDHAACREAGFDEVLVKPLTLDDLRRVVAAEPLEPTGVVDRNALAALRELEVAGKQPGFLAGMIAQFTSDAPAQVDAICAAAEAGQADALARAAHSLRSTAGALGALGLADRCGALEARARSHDLSSAIADAAALRGELAAVSAALATAAE